MKTEKSKISLVRCNDYENCKERMRECLDLLGGLKQFIKSGQKVLIKPNLIDPVPPEVGADTHPLFLKAIIELTKEITQNIFVGDASGGNDSGITDKCYKISGLKRVVEETGVEFLNFQETEFIPRDISGYQVLEKTDFAAPLFDMDFIINLPKFKTHGITFITGAIKNTFGCIHPLERIYLHKNFPKHEIFSKGIVDVYSFIKKLKPGITIMDAIRSMEGDQGPSHGPMVNTNLILAGEDGVAIDAVMAKITGHQPMAIPIIRNATERRVGNGNLDEIDVVGEKIEDVLFSGFKQSSLFDNKYKKMPGYGKLFDAIPVVNKEKCIKCGTCVNNCPVGAIKLDPYPEIDRKKCIKCFCCHEFCPKGAIDVKFQPINKIGEEAD